MFLVRYILLLSTGLLLHIALLATPILAQDSDLIVLDIIGLSKPSDNGSYGNVFNALEEEGLIKNWQITPILRAHRLFFAKKAACIAPASADLLIKYDKDPADFIVSAPFSKAYGYLYTAENTVVVLGQKPTLGDVGLGETYGINADSYQILHIENYDTLLTLVNSNRLNIAYITFPDIAGYPDAMKKIAVFKGTKERVWVGEDAIICHRDYSKKIGAINTKFQQWHQGDRLKELLGVYFFEE